MTTNKSNRREDVLSDVEIDAEDWLNDCFESSKLMSITDNELGEISKTELCSITYLIELLATIITAGRRFKKSKGEQRSNEWVGAMLSHIAVDLKEAIKCTTITSNDTLEELAAAERRITDLEESVSNYVDERDMLGGRLLG